MAALSSLSRKNPSIYLIYILAAGFSCNNMFGKHCVGVVQDQLLDLQLPAAAQFQWVPCAGSPGENGTGVCVSGVPPAALQ